MISQRVMITAGASGIGFAVMQRFIAAGARVAVCDIDVERLSEVGTAHPEILTRAVDVSHPEQVRGFVRQVTQRFGGIDVLINNAGIAGPTAPIDEVSDADWAESFAVNIHGAFYMLRAVVPLMKAQTSGVVINISSGSTITLPVNRSPYVASKWAIEGLTKAAARELGPFNIRVNGIRPGMVDGERMRRVLSKIANARNTSIDAVEAEALRYVSMGCKIQPQEIGDLAVFLASEHAAHITGQLVGVDGNIEWE